MTSNAGGKDLQKPLIGFGERIQSNEVIHEAVEKAFTPEFRNRLDAIIPFTHLEMSIMEDITRKEISKLEKRLQDKNVKLEVTDQCVSMLAKEGYSHEFGARNISRVIDEKISSALVDEVLFGNLSNGGKAICNVNDKDSENKEVVFAFKPKKITSKKTTTKTKKTSGTKSA